MTLRHVLNIHSSCTTFQDHVWNPSKDLNFSGVDEL